MATTNQTKNFYVTVTDDLSGCTTTDIATVTVASPIVNAGPDILLCDNGTVTLGGSAYPDMDYEWTPAGADWQPDESVRFTAQPTVFVATTTTFYVTATHTPTGCISTDEVTVTVGTPVPTFTMSDIYYCPDSPTSPTLGTEAPIRLRLYLSMATGQFGNKS